MKAFYIKYPTKLSKYSLKVFNSQTVMILAVLAQISYEKFCLRMKSVLP